MTKPIVSIIIATYNSESCIRESLESVQNNLLQAWECIVIDGASTDNTIHIVKEYEQADRRFSHVSELDKGIYDAFNKGWRLAKGDWIYYLGSDDELLSEGLAALLSKCDNANIVYGDMNYRTGMGLKTKSSISEDCLIGNMPCHQSMMMKRELIEKLNGFNFERYKICADFDLFQRAIKSGAIVKHVEGIIVACFNSLGVSSSIGPYMKECYSIKYEYKGFFFALRYVVRESVKRFLKSIVMKIVN